MKRAGWMGVASGLLVAGAAWGGGLEPSGTAATPADLPSLTPPGTVRLLTQDDATSTSTCIGNPITPLCAVETVMACFARKQKTLCRTGRGMKGEAEGGADVPVYDILRYRVVRTEIMTDRRFPWPTQPMYDRPGVPSAKVGDIRIDVFEKECSSWPGAQCFGWESFTYGVRKDPEQPGRWFVARWEALASRR